jgi:microsomal dipeptidase-like Zn-dependent dipeptidase
VKITEAMLEAGYSDQEIRMVMGENAVQFLRENLPAK